MIILLLACKYRQTIRRKTQELLAGRTLPGQQLSTSRLAAPRRTKDHQNHGTTRGGSMILPPSTSKKQEGPREEAEKNKQAAQFQELAVLYCSG
jgi:hypothetical protein